MYGGLTSFNVSATAQSIYAKTQILETTETALASGDAEFANLQSHCGRTVMFNVGDNPLDKALTVVVSAESGALKRYTLTVSRGSSPSLMAEGGVPQIITVDKVDYEVHTFTGPETPSSSKEQAEGELRFIRKPEGGSVSVLVVGGGGGGGKGSNTTSSSGWSAGGGSATGEDWAKCRLLPMAATAAAA